METNYTEVFRLLGEMEKCLQRIQEIRRKWEEKL